MGCEWLPVHESNGDPGIFYRRKYDVGGRRQREGVAGVAGGGKGNARVVIASYLCLNENRTETWYRVAPKPFACLWTICRMFVEIPLVHRTPALAPPPPATIAAHKNGWLRSLGRGNAHGVDT
jgi:hypothetical protein